MSEAIKQPGNLDDLLLDYKTVDGSYNDFTFNFRRRSIVLYLTNAIFGDTAEERSQWIEVLNRAVKNRLYRGYVENNFLYLEVRRENGTISKYQIIDLSREKLKEQHPFERQNI